MEDEDPVRDLVQDILVEAGGGFMVVVRRRAVTVAGTILLGAVWLLALAATGAAGLEFFLKVRSRWHARQAGDDSHSRFNRLVRAYEPFGVRHLNPQYLFFFPLDPAERVAISNETCSIDADGFRGPGPARAGGRRLAFLLGGSAAFGWSASSDATTITSDLNRLQDQYFFVNAGVVSWNSSQELSRLAFQILDYHPALIMTYDGANDAAIAEDYFKRGVAYPAGSPDSFDVLSAFVDGRDLSPLVDHGGLRGGRWSASGRLEYLFPELTRRIAPRIGRAARRPDGATTRAPRLPEGTLQAAVERYLSNLARMRDLTAAGGARFIAVFQPVAQLHRHFRSPPPFAEFQTVDRFHEAVMASAAHDFEFHDLGSLFDEHYGDIPVKGRDITDETVFVDQVHLYDPGNEIVARTLAGLLR